MEKKDQPKLVLEEQPDLSLKKLTYVSADMHAHLKEVSQRTNISITRLIDKMLRYSFQYLEIDDLKDSDKQ